MTPASSWQPMRVDDIPPQPWRNGGGVTRELLAWPDAQHWQLRISVADITADGPFSAFPGVDRWFVVLQGEGVLLQFADGARSVVRGQAPLRFDGAAAPGCRLRAGATRDLNVMAVRSAGRAHLEPAQAGRPWQSGAPLQALFTTTPLQVAGDTGPALQLPAWTLAVHTAAAGQRWWVRGDSPAPQAWWLSFDPQPSPEALP